MNHNTEDQLFHFPQGFVWGAATASYQIEGGYNEDGRGESIWDVFCRTPGKVLGGDSGNIACDHYHRWEEDIKLMQQLGLKSYRFSVAWPRIFPNGKGSLNKAGLDFYDRLVDGLLKAGITPFVTLYHWDLPQKLQEEGGWMNRDITNYFRDYVDAVSKRLSGRVHHWVTLNEPEVLAFHGYGMGVHAPGIRGGLKATIEASHHLLLSHGEAVKVLRENGGINSKVGIALNLSPVYAASESREDKESARRKDGQLNRWFLDPIFKGFYPADMVALYDMSAPRIGACDMDTISNKIDFLGVNYYTRIMVKNDPLAEYIQASSVTPKGRGFTDMGWEIYPEGLYEILHRIHTEYGAPTMYVTENGAAFTDVLDQGGLVEDPKRVQYLQEHVIQAHGAIRDGVDLKGYFAWSLLDNFEWAYGYSKRFGIVYVDYPSQKRIVKKSGHWYRKVIEENGVRELA